MILMRNQMRNALRMQHVYYYIKYLIDLIFSAKV